MDELRRRGHIITIATGRATGSAIPLAHRLGLDGENCYMITYNGSQIYDWKTGKNIYQAGLPMELVRFLFDVGRKFDIDIQTYSEDAVLVEWDSYDIREYIKIQDIPFHIVDDVTKVLTWEPPKVLAADYRNINRVNEFRRYIEPKVKGRADTFLSHPELLEFVPVGVNKGTAIHFLCHYLGLPVENTVAAGDAENDLTMLQAAHVGCAMINGEEKVKQAADYVTVNDCDHDGVAEILHHFILDVE